MLRVHRAVFGECPPCFGAARGTCHREEGTCGFGCFQDWLPLDMDAAEDAAGRDRAPEAVLL